MRESCGARFVALRTPRRCFRLRARHPCRAHGFGSRLPQRHDDRADARDAARDGRGEGWRRRLGRGPDGARTRRTRRADPGQGTRAVPAIGHDGQPSRDPRALSSRRRSDLRGSQPRLLLRRRRDRALLGHASARAAGGGWVLVAVAGLGRRSRRRSALPAHAALGVGELAQHGGRPRRLAAAIAPTRVRGAGASHGGALRRRAVVQRGRCAAV